MSSPRRRCRCGDFRRQSCRALALSALLATGGIALVGAQTPAAPAPADRILSVLKRTQQAEQLRLSCELLARDDTLRSCIERQLKDPKNSGEPLPPQELQLLVSDLGRPDAYQSTAARSCPFLPGAAFRLRTSDGDVFFLILSHRDCPKLSLGWRENVDFHFGPPVDLRSAARWSPP